MTDQTLTYIADNYYASLPNKDMRQQRRVVLFSGVTGSGKSTIAYAIEENLRAVRVSNDEIRDCIVAADPTIEPDEREQAKLRIGSEILERLARNTSGLIVVDASCDRGYAFYHQWAEKYGYRIVLLRLDIPLSVIKQRIRERGSQGYRDVTRSLAHMDIWWQQWEAFGKERHESDMVITLNTPIESVLAVVEKTDKTSNTLAIR